MGHPDKVEGAGSYPTDHLEARIGSFNFTRKVGRCHSPSQVSPHSIRTNHWGRIWRQAHLLKHKLSVTMLLFRRLELVPPVSKHKPPGLLVRQSAFNPSDKGYLVFIPWNDIHQALCASPQVPQNHPFRSWWDQLQLAWHTDPGLTFSLLRKMLRCFTHEMNFRAIHRAQEVRYDIQDEYHRCRLSDRLDRAHLGVLPVFTDLLSNFLDDSFKNHFKDRESVITREWNGGRCVCQKFDYALQHLLSPWYRQGNEAFVSAQLQEDRMKAAEALSQLGSQCGTSELSLPPPTQIPFSNSRNPPVAHAAAATQLASKDHNMGEVAIEDEDQEEPELIDLRKRPCLNMKVSAERIIVPSLTNFVSKFGNNNE